MNELELIEFIKAWFGDLKSFTPVNIMFLGLKVGQKPSVEVRYERIVNGVVETRRMVLE